MHAKPDSETNIVLPRKSAKEIATRSFSLVSVRARKGIIMPICAILNAKRQNASADLAVLPSTVSKVAFVAFDNGDGTYVVYAYDVGGQRDMWDWKAADQATLSSLMQYLGAVATGPGSGPLPTPPPGRPPGLTSAIPAAIRTAAVGSFVY